MQIEISTPVFHGLLSQYLEDAQPDDISKLIFTAMNQLTEWDGAEIVEIFTRIGTAATNEAKYQKGRQL